MQPDSSSAACTGFGDCGCDVCCPEPGSGRGVGHDGRPLGRSGDTEPRPGDSAARKRGWWRATQIWAARLLVVVATGVSVAGAFLSLRHDDLTGLLCIGFLFMQPTLYKAMTYGR